MKTSIKIFANRIDAGQQLAKALEHYKSHPHAIVLALPRGGVPVGFEIAKALQLPLDAFLVRKLGAPQQEELAIGAVAMGDVCVWNDDLLAMLALNEQTKQEILEREKEEIKQRNHRYRDERPAPLVKNRIVILVDDGLATGASMRAAIAALRLQQPEKIVVAVPVSARDTYENLKKEVEELVCLSTPEPFYGVGQWYVDFSQTTDQEVKTLLSES